MEWRKILSLAALLSVIIIWFSVCSGCVRDNSSVIDWEDCSQQIGDHPCDFMLIDQNGDEFRLYDHVGKIIIIDLSAMWCGPCQIAALEVEELQQKYNEDIVYVTILIENGSSNPPTRSNIKNWSNAFNIETAPVLAASRNFISNNPDEGWLLEAWPQFHIINKDMVLVESFKGFAYGRMESKIKEHIELSLDEA
jgi:thiol-disulfide isomerase/thioredoxin